MPRPRSRGIASSSATGSIKGISVEPGWRPIRHLSAEEEEEENRVGAVTPPSLSRVFSLVRLVCTRVRVRIIILVIVVIVVIVTPRGVA